jgi:WD40 repeat protein
VNDLVVDHQAHARAITELEYSTGAKALFSASRDTTIVQWTPAGEKVQQFDGHEMAVTGIATHPADPIVASGARNGDVYACTIFLPVHERYPALGFSAYVHILSESTVKLFLRRLTS